MERPCVICKEPLKPEWYNMCLSCWTWDVICKGMGFDR